MGLLSLAAGTLFSLLLLGGVVTISALVAGRWFCGWVCPVGSLQQILARLGRLVPGGRVRRAGNHQWIKYILFAAMAPAAAFGVAWIGGLDPMAILVRGWAFFGGAEGDAGASYRLTTPPSFSLGLLSAIILLSLGWERLWCRTLCPLGAGLGLLSLGSRVRIRRDQDACTRCNKCLQSCQHRCIDAKSWYRSECNYCMNCVVDCPEGALRLGGAGEPLVVPSGFSRRRFLAAGATGVALPLAAGGAKPGTRPVNPFLVRPPGAAAEPEHLARCLRCGICMEACPQGVITPTLLDAGWEGLFTPQLDFASSFCRLECNECATACPTDALEEFTTQARAPDARPPIRTGLAALDTDRCLPWAYDLDCSTCNEYCPTSPKAIILEDRPDRTVQVPVVVPGRCVGCGACQFVCPVPEPAILVSAGNESRSPDNRVTL